MFDNPCNITIFYITSIVNFHSVFRPTHMYTHSISPVKEAVVVSPLCYDVTVSSAAMPTSRILSVGCRSGKKICCTRCSDCRRNPGEETVSGYGVSERQEKENGLWVKKRVIAPGVTKANRNFKHVGRPQFSTLLRSYTLITKYL